MKTKISALCQREKLTSKRHAVGKRCLYLLNHIQVRNILYLEWRRGERFAGRRCHVVLQGVGEVVGVGVEEVFGEVDELKKAQILGLRILPVAR